MSDNASDPTLLNVENLTVRFAVKRGGGWGQRSYLYAVDDISFTVRRGETLAIVGESGSGKTTAALAVARLVEAYEGCVEIGGTDFLNLQNEELRQARAKVQFIFQDPYSSLNPRLRAEAIVREPLDSLNSVPPAERQAIVDRLFREVGLRPEQQRLFPHQFSGGQRQRIGIARALSTQPDLIICDEPVSALDVAVQAQILNLLRKLQTNFGLTYLFISHDLGVVQHMCDSIAVMYMGRIVEYADRLSLFNNPLHPYTAALLSAVPSVDRKRREQTKRILIPGDPPDPINPPKGCRFANRCPVAQNTCRESQPPLREITGGHQVACHLVGDDGVSPMKELATEEA
ncbi:MAG: ABC transporter ATP-binding protein [Pseudomonadota bacterium]